MAEKHHDLVSDTVKHVSLGGIELNEIGNHTEIESSSVSYSEDLKVTREEEDGAIHSPGVRTSLRMQLGLSVTDSAKKVSVDGVEYKDITQYSDKTPVFLTSEDQDDVAVDMSTIASRRITRVRS